jgi:hypothetical protein
MRWRSAIVALLCLASLEGCSSGYQQTASKLGNYKIVECDDEIPGNTDDAKLVYNFTSTQNRMILVAPIVYDNGVQVNEPIDFVQSNGSTTTTLYYSINPGQTLSQTLDIGGALLNFCENDPEVDIDLTAPSVSAGQGSSH